MYFVILSSLLELILFTFFPRRSFRVAVDWKIRVSDLYCLIGLVQRAAPFCLWYRTCPTGFYPPLCYRASDI